MVDINTQNLDDLQALREESLRQRQNLSAKERHLIWRQASKVVKKAELDRRRQKRLELENFYGAGL